MSDRCRHRGTWIVESHSGTYIEWCYECGALRRLMGAKATLRPVSPWAYPVGQGGKNPWDGWKKRCQAYRRRHLK